MTGGVAARRSTGRRTRPPRRPTIPRRSTACGTTGGARSRRRRHRGDDDRRTEPYQPGIYGRSGARLDPVTASSYANPALVPWPAFVTAEDRARVEREWKVLDAIDGAPDHFGREVLRWVAAHPTDLRAAEALHRVVRATRVGCTTEASGDVSREAFTVAPQALPVERVGEEDALLVPLSVLPSDRRVLLARLDDAAHQADADDDERAGDDPDGDRGPSARRRRPDPRRRTACR